ncbi:MAG TPA: ATP-binding cassette domain-containing protein [Gaiellaceae bacterium]|nr:ATP-binding cassette domain-containing protein [Gaiellaceae bacterium]
MTVLDLEQVSVRRARRELLRGVDWRVERGEHWALLGPNGAGKTTLLRIAAARSHPTTGIAHVLGERLGRVAVAGLHERIGLVEPALLRRFHPSRRGVELVLSGATGTIAVHAERLTGRDRRRAGELLELLGVAALADRALGDCSEGERTRLLLARALMAEPPLLLLDEPTGGLDLAGRELVLAALDALARSRPGLTTVTVTHHVEELPRSTTHALLLHAGAVVASGPAADVLADTPLSACFGVPVHVEAVGGRYLAAAAVPR